MALGYINSRAFKSENCFNREHKGSRQICAYVGNRPIDRQDGRCSVLWESLRQMVSLPGGVTDCRCGRLCLTIGMDL